MFSVTLKCRHVDYYTTKHVFFFFFCMISGQRGPPRIPTDLSNQIQQVQVPPFSFGVYRQNCDVFSG